ncbi:MAG: ABC transporter permease [Vicinamibacterales bacterium]
MTDLRLALRLCLRHPVLSLAAVASLALGIGANTAIFTVLNGSILQPLPYGDSDRLMVVWETSRDNSRRAVAPANFLDWRDQLSDVAAPFEGLAAFDDFAATLSGQFEAQRVRAVSASANFFEILRVNAQLGRVPTASEDRANATPIAVLSDGLWHRLFGGSPSAIGQPLVINGITFTIVGVLPQRFGLQMVPGAEVWLTGDRGIPRSFPFTTDVTTVRDSHIIAVVGRLAQAFTREQAQAQLTTVMAELSQRYPSTNAGLGAHVMPLHEEIVGRIRPLVALLQIAVAVLLLIACANVAHLLLGQAAGRQSEMFVRVALGAERSRLIRQLLIETLLIAVPGGVAGLALAQAGIRALIAVAPATVPRLTEIAIDARVLTFTCGMTLLTAVVFGLGPAWQVTRGAVVRGLPRRSSSMVLAGAQAGAAVRGAGSAGVRTTGTRRWHHALVVTELALAQMLLVGGGLMLASFVRANRVDLGFESEGRLAAEINLVPEYLRTIGDTGRIDPTRKIQFITRVINRMSSAPGVRAVAASFTAVLTGAPNRGMRIEGDPEPAPNDQPNADFQSITRDFFRATGITLVRGRAFTEQDRADSAPVVIVNQALVDTYFAERDPIGRVLLFGGDKRHMIVGIVASARYRSVEQPADPTFYFPLEQNDERWPFLAFTVWADGGVHGATNAVGLLRAAVREADPQQPITRLRTFDEILDQSLAARRFNTWIVGLFAATALLLAAVGTYGVMAYAVASRTRELGLRSALGARPADLIAMMLRQGVGLIALATALGLGSALALTRFMASLLFDVAPRDPAIFGLVAGVLTSVAIVATFVPARRAMRVDPMIALRDL